MYVDSAYYGADLFSGISDRGSLRNYRVNESLTVLVDNKIRKVYNMINSYSRQFTIREKCFSGPVLYVRHAVPAGLPGVWEWSKWRKARPSEIQMAIICLAQLQR